MKPIKDRNTEKNQSVSDCVLKIRQTVLQISPYAKEELVNKNCLFTLNGKMLLNVKPHDTEVGITTTLEARDAFRRELALYRQEDEYTFFSIDKPLPLNLIARIVRFKTDSYEYVKV